MFMCVRVWLGTHFRRLIPEEGSASQNSAGVKRLIFCTGKVYYDLTKERKTRGLEDTVAISRIEQVPAYAFIIKMGHFLYLLLHDKNAHYTSPAFFPDHLYTKL